MKLANSGLSCWAGGAGLDGGIKTEGPVEDEGPVLACETADATG